MTERLMDEIGVGLIGYGLGGRAFHAPYVAATPGMSLRAVVSRDPAKVHADLPGVRVLPDVEALLGEPGIDLVIVCSPDALHAEHAVASLRAGKHVLVDKPFATTVADARRMAAEAGVARRLLTAFHNRRWDADFLTLRRLLAEGALGRIVEVESRFDRWRPALSATWKDARPGGVWLDLGPHLVDQAVQLFGIPEGITADIATVREGSPAPDYVHAVLRYPGHRVVLHCSKLVADHAVRFAVHGTSGSWTKRGTDPQEAATLAGQLPGSGDWGHDPVAGVFTDAHGTTCDIANKRGDYRAFWTALAAAIRDGAPNPVAPSQAIAVVEILEAGLRSASERREMPLPTRDAGLAADR
jgi:predicted dehydrogenase